MKSAYKLILFLYITFIPTLFAAQADATWATILVHGTLGIGANFSGRTIALIKRDSVTDSLYEKNVGKIRVNPYLFALQPVGHLGLRKVLKEDAPINAAYIFSVLYDDMAKQFGSTEKNSFYTYGWSGLISHKERYKAARTFYIQLKELIENHPKDQPPLKIRIIGYSHGATMFVNFADIRKKEFCADSFIIDETIFLGVPITRGITNAIGCPPFGKVINIYSNADKVQRLDIFTSAHFFSERTFKKKCLTNVTQIELKYTAPLRQETKRTLPSFMRGTINQSPGHIELWSFGWARSMYRKNLDMFPLCAGLFIPFLIHAAEKLPAEHITVDIRPCNEQAYLKSFCGKQTSKIPFMTEAQYTAYLNKALTFHPHNTEHLETFLKLESSVDVNAYA